MTQPSAEQPVASGQGDRRARSLKLAYATSLLSKVVTALVQLLALPFAARQLGTDQFGAMLTLAAITSLFYIPGIGMAPAVSFLMARNLGLGDAPAAARAFVDALQVGVAAMLAWVAIGAAALWFLPMSWIYGREAGLLGDMALYGAAAMFAHIALAYAVTLVDGGRAAMQQNHISNIYALCGSGVVFALTLLFVKLGLGLGWMYLSIFIVPVLFQLANLIHFMVEHRAMLRSAHGVRSHRGDVLRSTLDFTRGQMGMVMHLHGIVFLCTQLVGLSAGAISGGIVRLYMQVNSLVQSVLNPLLPTLSAASSARDYGWQRKAILALVAIMWGALPFGGLIVAVGGAFILHLWLDLDMAVGGASSAAYAAWGTASSMALVGFLLMIALGRSRLLSNLLLVSGAVGMGAGYLCLRAGSLDAAIWINALLLFLAGVVPPSLWIRQLLKDNAAHRAAAAPEA